MKNIDISSNVCSVHKALDFNVLFLLLGTWTLFLYSRMFTLFLQLRIMIRNDMQSALGEIYFYVIFLKGQA